MLHGTEIGRRQRDGLRWQLVDGKEMASDGSYIPAEVSRNSWIDIEVEVEQSMLSYLDDLDQELASQPGFKKPASHTVTKKITTSTTDPECGYIHHGSKRGVGYLVEATVDCKHGIVTGVDVFPANEKESLLVLRHLERQQKQLGLSMEKVALDRGYDTGAVHRGLELLGITGYIPAIRFPNDPSKYGFSYDPQQDTFICPMGQPLVDHRLNCNKSTGKYLRCYQVQGDVCRKCTSRKTCFDTAGVRRITRYREMSAGNALPVRLVLIQPVCVEEFWPAAAILPFTEGI